MFTLHPNFRGTFTEDKSRLRPATRDDLGTDDFEGCYVIEGVGEFHAKDYDNKRVMIYVVRQGKILKIVHV